MKDTAPACQKLSEETGNHGQREGLGQRSKGLQEPREGYRGDLSYVLLSHASKRPLAVPSLAPNCSLSAWPPTAPTQRPPVWDSSEPTWGPHLQEVMEVFPMSTSNPQK